MKGKKLQFKSRRILLILFAITTITSFKAAATCQSDYTWTQTTDNVIAFTNTSTGTTASTSYYWSFGDGSYTSLENPVHTYNIPGAYNVCLHVTDTMCSSYFCDSITVTGIVFCNMTVACYEYAHASCATCADGAAHSYASGGTAPYSYVWNTIPAQTTSSATDLLPGTYTVCVTDANGCTSCCTVTIDTVGCSMTVSCYEFVHASCATCADGVTHSFPSGGTAPYSYVWNSIPAQTTQFATGLLPGAYTVCVTDVYGCSACCTTTIDTVGCTMTVGCYEYTHASCATCADGVAHSYPNGGTAPYTYVWNTIPAQTTSVATGLLPGAYTVCVTDANGCSACCTTTIDTVGCTMTVGCYEYAHASCATCADGVAHSYPNGGTAPYSYVWNSIPAQTTQFATGLLPGTYTVCVTDANGCSACCTTTIDTVGCTMTVGCYEYTHASCATCADGVTHSYPNGGTAPYTYLWNTIPAQTTSVATGLLPGAFTVCVTDANGCSVCCTTTIDTVGCTMTVGCYEYAHASCATCADGVTHSYPNGGTAPYTYVWNTIPAQTTSVATGLLPGAYTVCVTDANGCSACCTTTIDTVGCTMTVGCYEYTHASCATCADGVTHSFPSGGTAPYSYVWNSIPAQTTQFATGLLPGTYTVCVTDANGCSACCTTTIDTVGCTMTVGCYEYTHASCATCADGVTHSYPNGGTAPYTYVWNTIPAQTTSVATGLLPGAYTVCVTDANGCSSCCTVIIDTVGCTMTVGCYEYAHASCATCADGVAHSYATGGTAPYTYVWNTFPVQTTPSATGLLPGSYTVLVTDANGCSAYCTVTINNSNPNCSAYYYLYPDSFIAHTYWAVNASAGVSPLTYLWSWGDGSYDSIAYPSHTYATAGFYTICLYIHDSTGCTDSICHGYQLLKMSAAEAENMIVTVNVISNVTTAVQNINVLKSWSVFPNPAHDGAFINYTLAATAKASIELYDVLGDQVRHLLPGDEQAGDYNAYIDTRKLPGGIYVLQIHAGDQIASQKIAVIK